MFVFPQPAGGFHAYVGGTDYLQFAWRVGAGALRECFGCGGHANIGITLDAYSHVITGLDKEAAEQVAALFRTPVSNPLAEG